MVYTALQLISRGRESGLSVVDLSRKTGYDPKTCHYLVDKLLELNLVYVITLLQLRPLADRKLYTARNVRKRESVPTYASTNTSSSGARYGKSSKPRSKRQRKPSLQRPKIQQTRKKRSCKRLPRTLGASNLSRSKRDTCRVCLSFEVVWRSC